MSPMLIGGVPGKSRPTAATEAWTNSMVSAVPNAPSAETMFKPGSAWSGTGLRRIPPPGAPIEIEPSEAWSDWTNLNSSSSERSRRADGAGTAAAPAASDAPDSGGGFTGAAGRPVTRPRTIPSQSPIPRQRLIMGLLRVHFKLPSPPVKRKKSPELFAPGFARIFDIGISEEQRDHLPAGSRRARKKVLIFDDNDGGKRPKDQAIQAIPKCFAGGRDRRRTQDD